LIGDGLGVATSLLLRMALDPAHMGVWQALKLLLSYANFANLGISKAVSRDIAHAGGSGAHQQAAQDADCAFTFNLLTSLLYAVALISVGVGFAFSANGNPLKSTWAWGLVLVGLLALLQRHVTFHVTLLRARQQFALTARLTLVEALLTLLVATPAAWWGGVPGLCLATALILAVTWGLAMQAGAPALHWRWDRVRTRALIAVGLPLLLTGLQASLFRSLDRWLILGLGPEPELMLGNYSLALLVSTQLYGFGNLLSIVMLPRYAECYGRTRHAPSVARLAAHASLLHALALILLASLSITVAPTFLGWLLPDYRAGLAPIAWLIPGTVALVLSLPASQYLVALDRQQRLLRYQTAALLVGLTLIPIALVLDFGLVGVAAATSLSYLAHYALLFAASWWHDLPRHERGRYLQSLAWTSIPLLVLSIALATRTSAGGTLASTLRDVCLVLGTWLVVVAVIWPRLQSGPLAAPEASAP
jgi:O-antigen/teichoic acid export membrane protein